MKAVQINKYGGPEVLQLNDKVAEPVLKPGQVLVEVHAASINPFDISVLQGLAQKYAPLNFPATMGGDISGVVIKVADDVSDYKTGDQVYGTAIVLSGGSGGFAEKAAASTKNLSLKPKNTVFVEAASLPLVGSSAVQVLEEMIKLKPGQKVLIHGAAGGIGSIAVQIAKSIGAYVGATASSRDLEFVKRLGADEVFDYKTQSFEKILKDYDAVFDTVGGEVTDKSFQVLKKGGVLVSMKGQPNEEMAKKFGVTGIGVGAQTNHDHLKKLAGLVEDGVVKPQVDKVFPLEQTRDAFEYKIQSHPHGKVVVKIGN